jgi:predicted metal-binding protein
MVDTQRLEALFRDSGFDDFRWILPKDVVVGQWVRMKCIYGCPHFGQAVACPPNTPPIAECERFLREYGSAVLFHFVKSVSDIAERKAWSRERNARLLELERAVFLQGHRKAFMLLMGSCPRCDECAGRAEVCPHPGSARPTAEAIGVDVFETVRRVGFPIEVLKDKAEPMNRYALLLID